MRTPCAPHWARWRPDVQIVLVHDAARPFVSRETIDAVIACARSGVGAVAAVPMSDTIKQIGQGARIARTVARDTLWRAQTPQGFPRPMLEAAYGACGATIRRPPTTRSCASARGSRSTLSRTRRTT